MFDDDLRYARSGFQRIDVGDQRLRAAGGTARQVPRESAAEPEVRSEENAA